MVEKLNDLRAKCFERGAIGIHGISRTFRNMDVDHNDFLSLTEFTDGLKKFGLNFPEKTVQELFTYIDKDCSGRILFDEFLQAIRPPMSQTRIAIINEAFAEFDKETGDGVITLEDLRKDYIETEDGKVTKEEFTNYYSAVGANIDTDEEFVKMMKTAWRI
ncbi:Calcyphosin,Calcyphosin-like protein [Mytilus edulis]|uniref:Calcyphosin,Calcyphosin-like protein n=1 Tax=Mytilus edulis TaxID=6550 RepID=A0A8S3USU0_MYTED|nr:Calcyphosin,Calcyphosin-like protein [Mytilus edulis]